jgi:acetyltransferase-like isoleucine patch superfamily enzyme
MLALLLARLRARGRLVVDGRVSLGRGVRFDLEPGAAVSLGAGCSVGDGCRFHVGAGGCVAVGPGARLAERCVLAAHERIEIGAGARLGEEVVLIDFDHDLRDVEIPVREQGLLTAPIVVGERAIVDAAAGVLRGVTIGAGARAEGVPARVAAGAGAAPD